MYFSASKLAFINVPNLWDDAVEVPDDLHNRILEEQASGRILQADEDGLPITVPGPTIPAKTLEQVFSERHIGLNAQYEQAVTVLRGTYPLAETNTWPVQVAEAKAYDAWRKAGSEGTAPETPFLKDLSDARTSKGVGDGLVDLIDRVLANDALYSPAISTLTAIRHAAERDLLVAKAADDIAAVEAVTWDFSLS